jgi:tight adherence protein C
MPEPMFVLGSVTAGGLCASAVLLAVPGGRSGAAAWLAARTAAPATALQQRDAWRQVLQSAGVQGWLSLRIARAGWRESPERLAALTLVLAAGLGALGLSAAALLGAPAAAALALSGAALGLGAVVFALRSAVMRRKQRLSRELAPLLELFTLELGGGGSALSALGSVTTQLEGELAAEIRRLLIASQVAGSISFESRLRDYSDRLEIPAIGSLATILTASREYGTPVGQGVKALAADLRRVQRRELIAHSRRALNHVLFPAAIGVLLPFLAILLFPAVTSLERNLR